MVSCGDLGSDRETLHGTITKQPSCPDFSEEPIFEKVISFERVDHFTDCKENSTIDLNGHSSYSLDKNASFLGTKCVVKTVEVDEIDEMEGDYVSTDDVRNSGEKESKVSPNQGRYALDVRKVEPGGLCLEKVGSAAQEQMQLRDTLISSSERNIEGSDDGLAVPGNDNDNREGFVSKELELTNRFRPDASLPVNCQNQEDGKESDDAKFSPIPPVSEGLQGKGDLLTNADKGSDVSSLGGIETDAQLTFITDAPGNYLKECTSLEATKDRNVEIVGEDTSCTFSARVDNERGGMTDQVATSPEYTSSVQSCQVLSESMLETGALSHGTADIDLKALNDSLIMPKLLSRQVKEDDEKNAKNAGETGIDDLKDIVDAKTMNSELELLNGAELQSDIPNKNEEMLQNSACGPSSGNASVFLKENSVMVADMTTGISSQVLPVEEIPCSMEAGSPITRSSSGLDFPCISERSAIDVHSFNNTVDCFRSTYDVTRIDSEVACGSGSNFSEPVLSYSRRRGRDGKRSKKAQTKRIASHSRKSLRMKQPQINFESIFNCSKQKRSCLSKPAHSSEWGLPGNTAQRFLQDNNLAFNRPQNQGSQESQSIRQNREHAKKFLTGCPEGTNRKNQTKSGGCLRLKVKFGKSSNLNPLNIMVSKIIDKSIPTNDRGTAGAGLEISGSANSVKDKLQNGETIEQLEANGNSDKESDDSLMGRKPEKKDLEAGELHGSTVGDAGSDDLLLSSGIGVEECERATDDCYMDAETSPDSEVINSVPDALVSTSKAFVATVDGSMKNKDKRKGPKKDNSSNASRSLSEDGSPNSVGTNKFKQLKYQQMKEKSENTSLFLDIPSRICEKSLSYTHCSEDLPSELGVLEENSELESCKDAQMHMRFGPQSKEACSFQKAFTSAKPEGKLKDHEVAKSLKSNETKKGKSKFTDSGKSRRRNAPVQDDDIQKSINKNMVKDDADGHDTGREELHGAPGCCVDGDDVRTSAISDVISPDITDGEMALDGTIKESASTDSAWVRCDDCFKWRRIPASLLESIDENCRWICTNNLDKDFGDCSIPQEMSNEEINEELGITQDEADAYDCDVNNKEKNKGRELKPSSVNQKACFKAIKINQFLHRNRKAQTIDEVMVCHCKTPLDGQLGCGDECLNRMLNIECVQGTCPCGDLCSNQQFQKRKYTRFERFQSGKKGCGLRLLEDVRKGQFLIEYVGEVLDMQAYEARQKEYAAKGQKHFYFMTLNGNEVIDAGAKGNLGRFINHSCEPNCRTEKWMVNGEICVGIFSLRDIKKGEEVTFDYNYVRVFGAAAKRCYCRSLHCRGYIGGDSLNGDVIIQSDSDGEYPEPVMLEDDESGDSVLDATSRICRDAAVQMAQHLPKVDNSEDHSSAAFQSKSSVFAELPERELLPPLQPSKVPKECTTGTSVAVVQQEAPVEGENTNTPSPSVAIGRLSLDHADTDKNKRGSSENKRMFPRPRPLMKTSRPSVPIKRDKGSNLPGVKKAQIVMANKLQQQPIKSKGSNEVSPSGRMETFEGKLNELLDAEGGISKRKDSTKGYLKLLLLTAASRGNANSEGIQSNRDLSMILDALLKTKSRAVLIDVINKNGLQMLHNIMKQYRRDFKKTPILRKLLKVLEYLAAREILTLEHIIRRPPCLGMESFKDSILTLTEHDDKQVHQIARNFRDRWIPKPFRKHRYMERDERFESIRENHSSGGFLAPQALRYDNQCVRPTEPMAAVLSSKAATPETASVSEACTEPTVGAPERNGAKTRKRKSRWDQPAMKKEQRIDPTMTQKTDEMHEDQSSQDDIPPGFSLPLKEPYNNAPDIVVAHPQPKFLSRLPVSFGIPLTIVHKYGSPDKDASDTWLVGPAMPFCPFPPLPPVPRESFLCKKNGSVASSSSSSLGSSSANEHCSAPGSETNPAYNRKRGFSSDIGRRYFKQQKWNEPPWIRNGWENAGNSFRGMEPGSVTCDENFNNSHCSQGKSFDGVGSHMGNNSSQQQH